MLWISAVRTLSNLDAKLRTDMRPELHLPQRRIRATMVYVTYDQFEAMALADRVVVMQCGETRQVGRGRPYEPGQRIKRNERWTKRIGLTQPE
jgi:ABC-type sugar transport system ATPase subunit